jgi:hypothetical protein
MSSYFPIYFLIIIFIYHVYNNILIFFRLLQTVTTFCKYLRLKVQNPTIVLFKYCYSLSSSPKAKKWHGMVLLFFFKRRAQNPLKDIFQGKSLLVKKLVE